MNKDYDYVKIGVRCLRDGCAEKQCKHHAFQMVRCDSTEDLYGNEVCARYLEFLARMEGE